MSTAGAAPTDLASGQRALRDVDRRIDTTRRQLRQARERLDTADRALRDIERRIAELHRRITEIDQRIAATGAALRQDDRAIRDGQQRLDTQLDLLRRQLRAAYAMGRENRLKLLLSQNDAARLVRLRAYYGYLNQARQRRIADIERRRERLRKLRQRRGGTLARWEGEKNKRNEDRITLEAARARRARLVAEARKRVGDEQSRLARLRHDRKALRELLKRLAEEAARRDLRAPLGTPFATRKGKLPWPVPGRPRASGDRAGGVVIAAPSGTPVRAIHRGRVVYADWLRGYGLLTIVDHGDGYMSLYGRNRELLKTPGEWVEAGEPLARVGNSGGNRNAGVYFAIRKQGRAVDPRQWCKPAPGA